MSSIFPSCPQCPDGTLLPFSRGQDLFELWKCSKCGHTIYKK